MSEEVRTNKRRRSESEEPEDEGGDAVGADVVGVGGPGTDAIDGGRGHDNVTGDDGDDGGDQAAADAAAAAAEPPKMSAVQNMPLPVQMTHHQPRVEEKQSVDNYYKPEQQAVDPTEYKIPGMNVMAGMGGVGNVGGVPGMGVAGVNAGAMGVNVAALGGLGNMSGLATLGVPGMGLGGVGAVDLNQQILAAQQRQYEMNALVKAQMNNNAVAAAAAAARAAQKPPAPTGRKSAPSSYEPPVQLTASGRPARARRVNYAELAGAMDDEEEDDQANLVPNWARRRRKNSDQDRDYGVGVGGGSRNSGAQMGGGGGNTAAMYGAAGAGGFNAAPRAAAPAAGVNLYGLAGNAALGGQQGWQGGVMWGQTPGGMAGYGALQTLAAQRPQVAQQFLLQPGAARGVAPNLMQDMQLMLTRGADGQGGMPGAGQQR